MEPLRGVGVAFKPIAEGFEILEVFSDSPAAAAGLEKGDLVTHLDGTPIHERGCAGVSDFSDKGSIRFSVRRDAGTYDIDVEVKTLVP